MAMRNSAHPGAIVKEDCLRALELPITDGTKVLGRQALARLVNEKTTISIEIAYRLAKAFGSTP